MAVIDPDEFAIRPVGAECSLQVAALSKDIPGAVEAVRVRGERVNGSVKSGVAHLGVGSEWRDESTNRGVDHSEPIAWVARSVDRREVSTNHDFGLVG